LSNSESFEVHFEECSSNNKMVFSTMKSLHEKSSAGEIERRLVSKKIIFQVEILERKIPNSKGFSFYQEEGILDKR